MNLNLVSIALFSTSMLLLGCSDEPSDDPPSDPSSGSLNDASGGRSTDPSGNSVANRYDGDYLFSCAVVSEDVEVSVEDNGTDIETGPMEIVDGVDSEDVDVDVDVDGDVDDSGEARTVTRIYGVQMLSIQGSTASVTAQLFSDENCAVPFGNGDEESSTYSIVYTGGTTETALGTADHVDLTLTSELYNGQERIDETDIGNTAYSIFFLDGALFYYGETESENSGETPETRPTELSSQTAIRL